MIALYETVFRLHFPPAVEKSRFNVLFHKAPRRGGFYHHAHMKAKPLPPTSLLQECFTYNPETGELRWKTRPLSHFKDLHFCRIWNSNWSGKLAGHKHIKKSGEPGGILLSLNSVFYYAHRIIVALMGEVVPGHMLIDHRDLDPFNNKWSNLRVATKSQNGSNRGGQKRLSLLPKGVVPARSSGRFKAQIHTFKKTTYLGTFDTAEQASEAYRIKAEEIFGNFARNK